MTEDKLSAGNRKPMKRVVGKALTGILFWVFLCDSAYLWLESPHYNELDLPSEGAYSNWSPAERIVYIRRSASGLQRYFIWQRTGVFDTSSSADVADALDEWFINQDWQLDVDADRFGFAKFNPCQRLYSDADTQCRYYVHAGLDPKMRALTIMCGSQLAALYVEYMPNREQTAAVVTTINISSLSAIDCVF